MTEERLRERIYEMFGEQDYDIVSFTTCREAAELKCNVCGNAIKIKHLQNLWHPGRKNFCPHCAGTYNGDKVGRKLPFEEAQERLKDLDEHYEIIPETYEGWANNALIRHSCGKIFKTQPRHLFYHSHCPCLKVISKGENKIKSFLEKNNIEFEEQKRLDEMKKAPYDFYLPTYNLLIEFQGRQHYEPVAKFGGEKQLKIQKEIDAKKKEVAERLGYDILYISFKEMKSINEILVQRLSLTGVGSSEPKEQTSL